MKKTNFNFANRYFHISSIKKIDSIFTHGFHSRKSLKEKGISYTPASTWSRSTYGYESHRDSKSYDDYSDLNVRFGTFTTRTFISWFTSGKDILPENCHERFFTLLVANHGQQCIGSYDETHNEKCVDDGTKIDSEMFELLFLLVNEVESLISSKSLIDCVNNFTKKYNKKTLLIDYNLFKNLFMPNNNNFVIECYEFNKED